MTAAARLARAPVATWYRPLRTDATRIPRLVLASWLALFVNVLAPGGNPTVIPIPRPLLPGGGAGLAHPRRGVRPARQPPPGGAPEPLHDAAHHAGAELVRRLPAQRVHLRLHVPRCAAARLRGLPLAVDPVVGAIATSSCCARTASRCGASSAWSSWAPPWLPARRSPSRGASRGPSGRCRPPRWRTTPPCCSAPPSSCGCAASSAVATHSPPLRSARSRSSAPTPAPRCWAR